jgi:DNA polymerase
MLDRPHYVIALHDPFMEYGETEAAAVRQRRWPRRPIRKGKRVPPLKETEMRNAKDRDPDSSGPAPTLTSIVGAIVEHVELLREAGETSMDLDRESLRELGRPPPPAPASPAPPPPVNAEMDEARRRLEAIAREVAGCVKCPLHRTRTKTVPGQGHPRPDLLFIGEGPGGEEDRQGLAFIGRAGALLTRLITAMGLSREDVFIANIVKCRPTENGAGIKDRAPTPEEMQACLPYLRAQIAALQPRVIVTLGAVALFGLLGLKGITKQRGQWREYEGIPLMPTYHPSYLLRGGGDDTARYWEVWDDMVAVLARLGRAPPQKRGRPS